MLTLNNFTICTTRDLSLRNLLLILYCLCKDFYLYNLMCLIRKTKKMLKDKVNYCSSQRNLIKVISNILHTWEVKQTC